ncbi:MAG: hypothetical protein MJZ63_08200 [Muribaculaceae bacterium]|nr:hypothetical protein [Muribaculaceae bacterium]
MRALLTYILLSIFAVHCFAQAENEVVDSVLEIDTVYIYHDWKAVLSHSPVAAYSGQIVYQNDELETVIFTPDPEPQFVIDNQALAVCVGDSLWLASANYLNTHFKQQRKWFRNYMPLYFTEKIAFVQFWNDDPEKTFIYDFHPSFFIIDFVGKQLVELNYKVLTSLLARYPDLQCRYLGMKKFKERDVVDFFFMQYIDRLNKDDDALTIIEQLELR